MPSWLNQFPPPLTRPPSQNSLRALPVKHAFGTAPRRLRRPMTGSLASARATYGRDHLRGEKST